MAVPQEMSISLEEAIHLEEGIPGKEKIRGGREGIGDMDPLKRETRRIRPTESYGIDVIMQVDEEESSNKVWKKSADTHQLSNIRHQQ